MKLLTNLIFEPKGKHDPALAYTIKDTVMSADGSKVYFAIQDVPAGTALDNGEYWKLQIDLSGSKNAMDNAVAAFGDYAKAIGQRVKGETAKASGNPITFLPDAGSLLQPVSVFQPKQPGSGDPYPAGGGKNRLPLFKNYTLNGITMTVDADGTITLNGTSTGDGFTYLAQGLNLPAGNYALSMNNETAIGSSGADTVYCAARDSAYSWIVEAYCIQSNAVGVGTTATGIVDFMLVVPAGVVLNNFKMAIQLEAGSVATEYAPPANIRPIVGYDALELNHAGKNLFRLNQAYDTFIDSTIEGDVITTKFNSVGGLCVRGLDVYPAGTYTLSIASIGAPAIMQPWLYYADNYEEARVPEINASTTSATFTADRPFRIAFGGKYSNPETTYSYKVQLELSPTATPYEPYQNNTYTVQIGQTIYGGKFDWLTGKLTAEWTIYTITGTEKFTAYPNRTFLWLDGSIPYAAGNKFGSGYCSHGIFYSTSSPTYGSFVSFAGISAATGRYLAFIGSHPVFDSVDTLKAYFADQYAAGTPVQVTYKLAEPVEIGFITPHLISAVEPEQMNTLSGDGSIEVEYVKPLHVSIEERVAAAVASLTAK